MAGKNRSQKRRLYSTARLAKEALRLQKLPPHWDSRM
uniref:RE30346p n=1 Tax=Drosophila melanogaster TaxID=7227 RepID=Q8SYW6_DROME